MRDKSQSKNHVRQAHQARVQVTFLDEKITNIERGSNGTFKSVCEKEFLAPRVTIMSWKGCNRVAAVTERILWMNGDTMMEEEDRGNVGSMEERDALNTVESDVPVDCSGNFNIN